jgi:hypothetical protein
MADTHYEVLVGRGGSWSIHAVLYDESKAVTEAKEQMRTGRYHVVRVMHNKFDTQSGMFIERQVYSEGKEPKKSKVADDEGPANFCWRIDDIYSYEGRLTLRRLMHDDLDRWHITPIELLHCVDHVTRLEDTGTLIQHVVQRVAVVQCQETGKPIHERMRELYDLATAASEQLRGDWKAKRIPTLDPRNPARTLDQIRADARAKYFLNCALAEYLKPAKNWREKLELLLGLLLLSEDELLLKSVDVFVAEILSATVGPKEIFGAQSTFGAALRMLVDLYHGRAQLKAPSSEAVTPELLARLNTLITSGKLHFTHIELGKRITRDLKTPKPLTDGGTLAESQGIKELHQALMEENAQLIGGEDSWVELCKRSGKLLTTDEMTGFLGAANGPVERVERLLTLEQNILGTANKRKLADYLLPFITTPNHEPAYLQGPGTPIERLERLERLQRRVLASELMPAHREKGAQHLDGFAIRILKEAQLFARLRKSPKSEVEKALMILRLCASGTFTQGRALEFARGEARGYMKTPNFIDLYLAGAASTTEMAARLMELQRLLEAAGMRADGSTIGSGPAPEAPAAAPEPAAAASA